MKAEQQKLIRNLETQESREFWEHVYRVANKKLVRVPLDYEEGDKLSPRVRKWIDALRSGKYTRISRKLRDGKGYCCLGVACDISGLGSWNPEGEYQVHPEHRPEGASQADCYGIETMPKVVADWFGLRSRVGKFKEDVTIEDFGIARQLSTLNDDVHWDFNQIADFIEENWDNLKQDEDSDSDE